MCNNDWEAVGRTLVDELENIPPDEQIAYIRSRVEQLPEQMREPVSHFVTAVIKAAKEGAVRMPDPVAWWEKILAVVCGVGFMITLIVLAIYVPNPTPFQYEVFRVILAIAVAGFAATIPGFLHVQIPNLAKAGGALAVFLLVYFYNPAQLVVDDTPNIPASEVPAKATTP